MCLAILGSSLHLRKIVSGTMPKKSQSGAKNSNGSNKSSRDGMRALPNALGALAASHGLAEERERHSTPPRAQVHVLNYNSVETFPKL